MDIVSEPTLCLSSGVLHGGDESLSKELAAGRS